VSDERTVWYRKWRPQTFAEVNGQDHVTRTLRNAVASGRVAHAYLLCGPRGTGKTTTARLLAKAVNCTSPQDGEPCDRCDSCVAVREGRALDLVEMDAASNRGIDDIRELRERVGYAASGGRFKVYLIDEVHELTQQAFDALLKTLEEPPAHVIFVLATTDAHRVPATIVSRCQRFDLTRARLPDLVARLRAIAAAEGVAIDDEALHAVARAATGSFRDAVGLLEQLVASYGHELSPEQVRAGLGLTGDARALDLARAAIEGDLAAGLTLIAAVRDDGVDLRQFTREVVARLRALLLIRAGVEAAAEADGAEQPALAELASGADVATITRALKAFGGADFRADPQASLPLELALVDVTVRTVEPVAAAPVAAAPSFAEARPAARRPAPAESTSVAATPAPAGPTSAPRQPAAAPPGSPPSPAQPVDQLADLRERLAARKPAAAAAALPAAPATPPPAPTPPVDESPSAETASPEPARDLPAPAEERLTLADARARYRAIYQHMQSINRLVASRINPGDIIAVDGEAITFGLPHKIQVDKLAAGSDAHRALTDAVTQVFGRAYTVHCVHMPEAEDRLRAQPTRRSHLLDEAIKLGAQPL
jgi:DNA polymerase-3 subunit gamma/tau